MLTTVQVRFVYVYGTLSQRVQLLSSATIHSRLQKVEIDPLD